MASIVVGKNIFTLGNDSLITGIKYQVSEDIYFTKIILDEIRDIYEIPSDEDIYTIYSNLPRFDGNGLNYNNEDLHVRIKLIFTEQESDWIYADNPYNQKEVELRYEYSDGTVEIVPPEIAKTYNI